MDYKTSIQLQTCLMVWFCWRCLLMVLVSLHYSTKHHEANVGIRFYINKTELNKYKKHSKLGYMKIRFEASK